jgi:zinc finger protein
MSSTFQPSDTFQGPRDGFHFKAGDEGTGYYADAAPAAPAAAAGEAEAGDPEKAPEKAPVLLSVDVPAGAEPGDVMQVQVPSTGAWVDVTVPEGAVVGSKIQVIIGGDDATTAAAAAASIADVPMEDEEIVIQQEIGKQVGAGAASIQIVPNSRCMQCQGTGVTHLLPTVIPYFKEIIVCHFKCGDCGWSNTETMETSNIQAQGSKITFTATTRNDLDRRVIKSKHASIVVKELGLTLPSMTQRGTMTTIEGILTKTMDHLRQDQDRRREVDPALAEKLDDFIARLVLMSTGLELPFTMVLDDPTGNSHIENPTAPAHDPNMTNTYYNRTKPQNIMIGFKHLSESAPAPEAPADDSEAMKQVKSKSLAKREGWIEFDRDAPSQANDLAEKRIAEIPMDCPACGKEGGTMKSCQTNIPHFKDVVILAFVCDLCGYKTNEIKAGGGVPAKGRRWTLTVTGTKPEDLHRDILKSNTACVKIPELGFEMEPGSLGGVYSTVEGLLLQIHDRLKGSNPFSFGDAAEVSQKSNFAKFLYAITEMRGGLVPFTLIIEDPMDHSFIYSPAADGFEDDDLVEESYTRSHEEDEEFGLLDMVTDGYNGYFEDGEGAVAGAGAAPGLEAKVEAGDRWAK